MLTAGRPPAALAGAARRAGAACVAAALAGTAACAVAASLLLAVPAVAATAAAATGPSRVRARGAELMSAATGRRLWARDPRVERPIASITKVMTALVVLRAGGLNREVRITRGVAAYPGRHGGSTAGLRAGDVLTARQLLEGLLLPSGCDAALALADAYGPGWRAFVRKMNAEATRLGMDRTHFANFDGLPWPTEYTTYSTPADLMVLGRAAMRYPLFRRIAGQRRHYLAATRRHHAYLWRTTNKLIGRYRGAVGIKTGTTAAAGGSLLFEAVRGDRALIGVVLYTPPARPWARFTAAERMLAWGFRH